MTKTTQDIFETYQVRKTKKQKTDFIEYVKQLADCYGYDFVVDKGSFGARNIVIGNPGTAKVLYTAHYDTCSRLPFPNLITPKNFFVYLLYQLLIVGVFVALFSLVGPFAGFVFLFLLLSGPANKHTANDNTSGVTTVLDIMQALPQDQKDKVAFVLFDLEEAGLFGSSSFTTKHRTVQKNTLVINFDCVSDGSTILFALKRGTKKYAELLEKAFVPTPDIAVDITRNAFYPSDNMSFKRGIGVAALKKSKFGGILYMDRIHTKRDVIYREENIRFLVDGAIKLAQTL